MDTSEVYIKMCEKATEIQERKQITGVVHGDYVYALPNSKFSFFTGKVVLFTGSPHLKYALLGCVFIPRQDQLQEMFGDYHKCIYFLHDAQCPEVNFPDPFPEVTSMEQLWLCFVMQTLYRKVWAEGKWVSPQS